MPFNPWQRDCTMILIPRYVKLALHHQHNGAQTMFNSLTKTPLRVCGLAVTIAALVGGLIAPAAFAKIVSNTIDSVAIVATTAITSL